MKYGYFDDDAKEYVITRPDTPQSWSNYLGSTEYGAVITNNAGGYGFYKSGARGRFLRLRFNAVPMDQPGRYFYLRDRETGDYWSSTWQPVGKPLDSYKTTCRHGTAYTSFQSEYSSIIAQSTYFVPLGQSFEYWRLSVTNTGDKPRKLSAFTYCEFTNQWDTTQDQVNLQYSLFITKGERNGDFLRISIQENLAAQVNEALAAGKKVDPSDLPMSCWMTQIGSPIVAYDTSRAAFIGVYGGYHAPAAVVSGQCSNSDSFGDNSCGSMQSDIELSPGETKELLVMLGIGEAKTVGARARAEYGSLARCEEELRKLRDLWHSRLESLSVETPDEDINHTVNVWGLYNCLITFAWSRAASLVYNGERDGLGFRDSVQDILGVAAAIPDDARARLELLLTGQCAHGGAIPVIKPFEHVPGKEKEPKSEDLRSDDCLWFFNAVPTLVAEIGDFSFYDKILPFADRGETSVLGHLKQALLFNLERMGAHGLPCGLSADWNDCLRLGYRGESLFVAFQLRYGLTVYADIAARKSLTEERLWAEKTRDQLDASIQRTCWDGEWFIWAIAEDGTVYGTKTYEEGQVYFNTQVWAVLSGAATPEQAKSALSTVKNKLATPYGLMLSAPPFKKTSIDVMRAIVFNPGIKENAGIFNHTQGWGIMAESLLGNGNRAFEYCKASLPAAWNDRAEIRQMEPYVQGQTTYSSFSPRPGNARTSWLSGAASWAYYSLTQYLLGIRPEYEGLRINPCIPSSWEGFRAVRIFRGKKVNIEVRNPRGIEKGVAEISVNGTAIRGNLIPAELLREQNEVFVVMG